MLFVALLVASLHPPPAFGQMHTAFGLFLAVPTAGANVFASLYVFNAGLAADRKKTTDSRATMAKMIVTFSTSALAENVATLRTAAKAFDKHAHHLHHGIS